MTILKEGFLQKYSSGIFKGWKKRHFVLYNDGHLVIYDSKGGAKAASYLISRDCRDIQVGAGIPLKIPPLPVSHMVDCVFLFVARDKKFLLLAENRRELDSWLQALNNFRGNLAVNGSSYPITPTVSHPAASASYAPANPTAYPSAAAFQPQYPPSGPSLGFEHLNISSQNSPYPPQLPASQSSPYQHYPPQPPASQSPYQHYPPQPPASQSSYQHYPPQQSAYQPVPSQSYPAQQPGAYSSPQAYPSGPPVQYGGYPQPVGYAQPYYGHQPGTSYSQTQAYSQPYKSKSGGLTSGLGALMGGGLGSALGMAGKKGKKHKKVLGGTAAALAGGYVLHKATRRGSWGSWGSGSWGSVGSFGSFGSFGS